MASYDWFTPTPAQEKRLKERAERLGRMNFMELGYPDKKLVCSLCGSIIYGTIEDKWAELHRGVCRESTTGKHRA